MTQLRGSDSGLRCKLGLLPSESLTKVGGFTSKISHSHCWHVGDGLLNVLMAWLLFSLESVTQEAKTEAAVHCHFYSVLLVTPTPP